VTNTPLNYALAANNKAVYGTLALSSNGSFTYTPGTNFIGEDIFNYQVTDNNGGTGIAQVRIVVNPIGNEVVWPNTNSAIITDTVIEAEIADLVARMSLAEKVGQMTQAELQTITADDVRTYHLGSVLNGGGSHPQNNKNASAADWVALADAFYNASMDTSDAGQAIPIIWGTDAVHGHNNVKGATLFPHNIGLGATHNPDLIKSIGAATAKEVAVTGIDWTFAPTIAVVRDDRWGRTYESYSEDPEIVRDYAGKMIEGLQGTANTDELFSEEHVIATAKHFVGDGGTDNGTNEGNNSSTELNLRDIHAQGYFTALGAGAQTVMASFNSWQGNKLHGSHYLLTHVLKTQMGFDGFVIGDWNGHAQVPGCTNSRCARAINAGVDMIMVPYDWKVFIENTITQVESGDIPIARINDAVTRILRVKKRAGLFTKGAPSTRALANDTSLLGATEHRTLARQAVRESLVLLKNKNAILPLARNINVLVAGDGANSISRQNGGWTLTWQGTGNTNADFPGATSIYQGISSIVTAAGGTATLNADGSFSEEPDVAVVVFGESPYAETNGDLTELEYQEGIKSDLALLNNLKGQGIPVVSIFLTGRPLWTNKELNASDAFVVAWLPGSEGAGIADVIFKKADNTTNYDFVGKLAHSWPNTSTQFSLNRLDEDYAPLFAYGFGLTYADTDTLGDMLPEEN
jgi:beta-glucosidase